MQVDARVSCVAVYDYEVHDYRRTVLYCIGFEVLMALKIENTNSSGTTSGIKN
jgi:hypothetical protein